MAVSLTPSDFSEVRRYGIIGGALDDVLNRESIVRIPFQSLSDCLLNAFLPPQWPFKYSTLAADTNGE